MDKIFVYANQYIQKCNWKDIALIKFCLCAIGVLIGVSVAPKYKKVVAGFAAGIFIATYLPLMAKFLKGIYRKS